jgi:SAM-dependent methyltransferase
MFSATADLYDLIYESIKDYRTEAAAIAATIRRHLPSARTVLDVACGTGEHARYLATEHGFRVDGIDLEPRFVELARVKVPDGTFRTADMTAFDLGTRYDAVLCLFSSIGYAKDVAQLRRAIAGMTRHVREGGVLIVEPWFEPDAMEHGHVTCITARNNDVTVCRMSFTEITDHRSRLHFEYLIGSRTGLQRVSETHELGLFTRAEMEAAFHAAGVACVFDGHGITGRGLYVAGGTG